MWKHGAGLAWDEALLFLVLWGIPVIRYVLLHMWLRFINVLINVFITCRAEALLAQEFCFLFIGVRTDLGHGHLATLFEAVKSSLFFLRMELSSRYINCLGYKTQEFSFLFMDGTTTWDIYWYDFKVKKTSLLFISMDQYYSHIYCYSHKAQGLSLYFMDCYGFKASYRMTTRHKSCRFFLWWLSLGVINCRDYKAQGSSFLSMD